MSSVVECERCRKSIPTERPTSVARCPSCGHDVAVESAGAPLKLRDDLVVEEVEEAGALYYVIKDPETNRFFRIKPLEFFLISQFDGGTPLAEIRRRASEERKVLVSEEVLSRFADKFRELGLLTEDPGRRIVESESRGNLFRWKLPLANPELVLEWLYPKLRFCFSQWFVGFVLATLVCALAVAITHRHALVFGFTEILSLEGLFFVLVTITGVTMLHELAHGLTCRHFGGRVTDMGLLLLYFLPCFYCNVSDTYLFRAKRQRLWVLFSGGFFELFVWASSLLLWRVAAPETFASRALTVVVAVCGLRALFNFNPLIKMDGYFMLSEYLGIANLRREALKGVARGLRRLLALEAPPPDEELQAKRILAMRGDRFLTVFGGLALVYTCALVGTLFALSGGWVFERFGADALFVFAIGLLGLLHKPAVTAANAAKEAGKETWRKLGDQKKRSRSAFIWGGLLLVTAAFPWQLRVPSELTILPQEREIVRAPADGRIAQIHVREGDYVDKGDLLLEYDDTELVLEHRTKEAELAQAREELRLLQKQNPTFREEIIVKERALETARAQEEAVLQDFERHQLLLTDGLVSKQAFEKAQNQLEQARARRAEAEAEIALARKQSPDSRGEQMEVFHLRDAGAQEAVIEKLEAELAQLEDLLARTKIYASISGTITTYRFEEREGDYLEEGAEVCEIANDDEVVIEMPVSEKDIDVIELGQNVKFKVRGYPTRTFRSSVDEIAPVATPSGETSSILLRSRVDNADKILKPGMTGVAKVYCGLSVVAHVLTRDLIRFIRTEFWL